MRTTIFIPISREDHLAKLFASLEALQCDSATTSLFTYVDGPAGLYVKARNFTEQSKFGERLCVQRPPEKHPVRNFDLYMRRLRIAQIQNEAKQYLGACDYIFGIEDDTIVPANALTKLLRDYGIYPYAGFISGVELGRWGIPYVGAWRADDVYEPTKLETAIQGTEVVSADLKEASLVAGGGIELGLENVVKRPVAIEEIDAGGFYCYLTRAKSFLDHEHTSFDGNNFGPDVAYGLALRQQGLKNYIDWSIQCEHRKATGEAVTLANTQPRQVVMTKRDGRWRQQVLSA
jgi:hypothetical protein